MIYIKKFLFYFETYPTKLLRQFVIGDAVNEFRALSQRCVQLDAHSMLKFIELREMSPSSMLSIIFFENSKSDLERDK